MRICIAFVTSEYIIFSRVLVAGVRASGLDLTAYGTEADIASIIHKRLKG